MIQRFFSCESCLLFFPFLFFLFGAHHSDRGTIHRNTGSECFLWGYMECQEKKYKPRLKKHSHQDNPWKNPESISGAARFQEEGEKRANLSGNTTPCSAGKECALSQAELRACLAWKQQGKKSQFPRFWGWGWWWVRGSLNWSSSSLFTPSQ